MKRSRQFFVLIFFILLGACFQQVYAQTGSYLTHTIKAGETLSGLARQYHTTVGDIMRLNKMTTSSKLVLGESVKIPQPKNPVVTKKKSSSGTTVLPQPERTVTGGEPIYHIVLPGESLYSLSKKYHTTIATLKKWNNLKKDIIVDGHKIVVGYTDTPVTSGENPVTKQTVSDVTPENKPVTPYVAKSETRGTEPENKVLDTSHLIDIPKNLPEHPESETPSGSSANAVSGSPVGLPQATGQSTATPAPQGFFTPSFGVGVEGRSIQTVSGTAMTFKSASGWTNKKYYILMNNVPPGSVVKISADNTVIYAKVLWSMSDIKENDGIDFRISTAAAAALGLSEAKFPLTITYYE